MPRQRLTATTTIDAPPALVYQVFADYRQHHPRILPAAFSNFAIQEGGVGAGTKFTFDLRVLGRVKHYAGVAVEPEPGRLLVEKYPAEDSETSFLVEPAGSGSRVTIATEFNGKGGFAGTVERWLAGRILLPMYADELDRVANYVRSL
jgi:uncharacterized protein YndB with AHSA1/START domain